VPHFNAILSFGGKQRLPRVNFMATDQTSQPSSAPARYLVTGASGLVGNNVVRMLLQAGNSVRVLARKTTDPRPFEGLPIEFFWADLATAPDLTDACQGVDVVIHAAGHVHMGWSELDKHHQINVVGTRKIATAARKVGAKFVHVSSVNALGLGKLEDPATEVTILPGIAEIPYVITKREAEQVIFDQQNLGLQAIIVNPAFMLGPWDWKPSSGRMLIEIATNRVPAAPSGAFSVADVRDVCSGILNSVSKIGKRDRYILAGHNLTYQSLWQRFAAKTRYPGPRFRLGPVATNVLGLVGDTWGKLTGHEPEMNSSGLWLSSQQHCFSSQRAEEEIGYHIRPLQETIDDAWNWLRNYGFLKVAA